MVSGLSKTMEKIRIFFILQPWHFVSEKVHQLKKWQFEYSRKQKENSSAAAENFLGAFFEFTLELNKKTAKNPNWRGQLCSEKVHFEGGGVRIFRGGGVKILPGGRVPIFFSGGGFPPLTPPCAHLCLKLIKRQLKGLLKVSFTTIDRQLAFCWGTEKS